MKQNRSVAIVYDWVDSWGGVERLLQVLLEMFPQAPIYTSSHDRKNAQWAEKYDIRTSFIQKLPHFIRKNRLFSLFLYPYAFESFDLTPYDIVISVTSFSAKSVITNPNQKHISLILTPPRFLWVMPEKYIKYNIFSFFSLPAIHCLRLYDYIAAQRPDVIIPISQTVDERCKTYYNRSSDVIYPPFDYVYWQNIQKKTVETSFNKQVTTFGKYYLVVGRVEQYKNTDLVIETFSKRPEDNLLIVGYGRQTDKVTRSLPKNITYLRKVSDLELGYLYQHAQALIMPQEEDFGYVSLEAQACGCPVIAYGFGGATETVKNNETGLFFENQTSSGLAEALERFSFVEYNRIAVRESINKRADIFGKESFKKKMMQAITN